MAGKPEADPAYRLGSHYERNFIGNLRDVGEYLRQGDLARAAGKLFIPGYEASPEPLPLTPEAPPDVGLLPGRPATPVPPPPPLVTPAEEPRPPEPVGGGFRTEELQGLEQEALVPPQIGDKLPGFAPPALPVDMGISPSTASGRLFQNGFPQSLEAEIRSAMEVEAKPIHPADEEEFAAAVNQGQIKFVVTEDGELWVVPQFVDGREISHAFLSGGRPVLTAGVADIVVSGDRKLGLSINEHSGHFLPTKESLKHAYEAFREHGVEF